MEKIISTNIPDAKEENPSGQSNYKWKVLSTVLFGIFMVILDTTVVNVAFQAIRMEFGGDINVSQWVISIYVLVLGITTPLAGFLADRFGAKKIYLSGLGLFAFGSLMCGLSPNLGLLIAARAIQGVGGGIAMPLGIVLLLQAFPVKEHGKALGLFGIAALVAPAIGPILGGWLVDQNLWRVIFFVNPPIGLAGVILGIRFLRERQEERRPGFDLAGIITEIIGFGSILYAASIAADEGWTSPVTLSFLLVGVVGLICFGIVELKFSKFPLMDLYLFKNPVFLNASVIGYVSVVALFGAEFLMPVYLQSLRGMSAFQTGLVLLPMAVAGGIFVTLSGQLYDRLGPRPLLVSGFALLVINTWQLSQIQANTPISWIIFLLILRGFALGLTVQTTIVTSLSVIAPKDLPRGSSLANSSRLVIQSIGVALLATVLASALSPEVKTFQDQFQTNPSTPPQNAGLCQNLNISDKDSSEAKNQPLKLASLSISKGGFGISDQACHENIVGFERSYTVTFFAALIALFFGFLLPGWPGKWSGRQAGGPPVAPTH
jgi:EmrB/QacA subfamily drug resistance transporter